MPSRALRLAAALAFAASAALAGGCSQEEGSPTLNRVRTGSSDSADSPGPATSASSPISAADSGSPAANPPSSGSPGASSPASGTTTPAGTPPAEEHTGILEAPGAYVEAVVGARLHAKRTIWLADMTKRVQAFEAVHDRKPASLAELAQEAPLPALPPNMEFSYDPRTGAVDLVDKN